MNPDSKNSPGTSSEQENKPKGGNASSHSFMNMLAMSSTWLFSLAVIGTGIIAAVLFIYGFLLSIAGVIHLVQIFTLNMEVVKEFLVVSIEIIDIFLVATVFYLISLGLYELFIAKAPLPGWVEIRNLDDLKTKLLGLAVIALVVIFLGAALTMSLATVNILEFGIAIALIIAAVSAYLWVKH
jgi:uncharacterized membrane protein YqhA